jgi:methylated-DNA-[protein]-cysteine S-methyltransferase
MQRRRNHRPSSFSNPEPEQAPATPLAAEAVRQLKAYLLTRASSSACRCARRHRLSAPGLGADFSHSVRHQTNTYGQLAKNLKNAPRAVGQACGANPFPLVVPCHRVVATGGGLGGFARQRGGFLLDVKRWLLRHEGS